MLSTLDKTWSEMNILKQSNAASCMLEADLDDSNDMVSDVFKLQLDCMNRRLNSFNYEKRILKDLDLFVLDNSLQESTVGHVRGHTLENKWKIYNEVKKVGIEHIAVASFSRSTHSGEPFAHDLQTKGVDGSKHFAFVDCFDTCTETNTIKTDLPTGLEKCKKYGINNVIMELDLVSREMNYGMFNAHRICELLSERIAWIRQNISESSLVFVNIRDFSDSMKHHPARVLFLINYLASFPENERVLGIMYEDGGKYYSEQLAVWTFCVREELIRCSWKKCHLLANIRDQYGLCNGTLLDCLADGATGMWAGICEEGASMGHASYSVAIMNLIRLGNTSVGKKYKCSELREAARSVTAIVTGHPPYPRQPVIGDRWSGIYFGLEPLDEIAVQNVKYFNESVEVLMQAAVEETTSISSHLEGLIDEIRNIWDEWNIVDEQQGDELEFSAFHNAFAAPYFSGWRDNETTTLLEAIQIKKGTKVSWLDFVVHLKWAANEHPETETADELLNIAFRQRILVAMEERLVEQVETQAFVHYNQVRSETFYNNYTFNPDLFFRKAQPQVDIEVDTPQVDIHAEDTRVEVATEDFVTEDETAIVVQEVAVVESGQDEDDFFAELDKMEPSVDEVPQVGSTKYKVRIKTGDIDRGGTDSHVYIILCGDKEKTDKLRLEKEHFDQDGDDLFNIEDVDVGNITSIIIGHEDNGSNNKAWYLVFVDVTIPTQGRNFHFTANRWLDANEGDNKIEVTLHPQDEQETYEITGKTDETTNDKEIEEDEVEIAAKTESDWVDVMDLDGLQDKIIQYEITVKTGDCRGAGTDANVFICLYGDKNIDTGYIVLGPQDGDRAEIFERERKDEFTIDAIDVGNIKSVRIGHDNKGGFAGWYLDWVSVKASGYYLMFSADRWLDTREGDKKLEIELTPTTVVETDQLVKYDIIVKTGDINGAGTDANVYICLFGEEGKNTGNIVLGPKDGDRAKIFERNVKDQYSIDAIDIGELKYIRIGHDNKGGFAGWYLDWVSVKSPVFYLTFKADRWLDLKEGNGKLEVDLYPKVSEEAVQSVTFTVGKDAPNEVKSQKINVRAAAKRVYSIYVKTGDVRYAGTDAIVHCIIYGTNGVTKKLILDHSKSNKSPFERKQVDLFTLEELDVGNIEKIRIGHDGSGPGAGWYLEDVVIDAAGINRKWTFVAKRWLDRKTDDGKLEVDLKPSD